VGELGVRVRGRVRTRFMVRVRQAHLLLSRLSGKIRIIVVFFKKTSEIFALSSSPSLPGKILSVLYR